jgi:hypothetical protein
MNNSLKLKQRLSLVLFLTILFFMLAFSSCKEEDECEPATIANAGADQNIFGTTVTLSANTPGSGLGLWTIVSGEGGEISDESNPSSAFTGELESTYVLKWTIAGCPASEDEVSITFSCTPVSAASAGADQNVVGTSTTLTGNLPTSGNGEWSVVSGAGGTIAQPSNAASTFNGAIGTRYTLKWTISGCGTPSEDLVEIEFFSSDPKFISVNKTSAMTGEILTITGVNFSANYQGGSQVNFVKVGAPNDGQTTYLFILSRTATEIQAVVSGANGGEQGTYNLTYMKKPDANAPTLYPSTLNVNLVASSGFYTSQSLSANNVTKGTSVSFGVKNGSLTAGDYTIKLVDYNYETGATTEVSVPVTSVIAGDFSGMDKVTFTVPANIAAAYYFVKVTYDNKTLIGGWGTGLNVF